MRQKTTQKKIQKINLITEFLLCKKNDDIKSTPSFRKHTQTHIHTTEEKEKGKQKTHSFTHRKHKHTQTQKQPHKSLSSLRISQGGKANRRQAPHKFTNQPQQQVLPDRSVPRALGRHHMFPAIDLPEDPEMQENVFSPLILNRAYRTKAWYIYCPICSSTRSDVGGNKRKTERIKKRGCV